MSQPKKLSFYVMVIVLSMLGCKLAQPSIATPNPSVIATITPTFQPTPIVTATMTIVPFSTPTSTATQPPAQSPQAVELFRRVISILDLPDNFLGDLQVRALGDDKVWVYSSHGALLWNGETWDVAFSGGEEMLDTVDDSGQLWALRQDVSEVASWQDEKWTIYSADRGWLSTSTPEEMSWFSTATWSASIDATNKVWLPMAQEVSTFDGSIWNSTSLEEMGFPSPDAENMGIIHRIALRAGGEEVWVGECYYSGPGPMGGGGVRWFDGNSWQGMEAPVGSTCVSAMDGDLEGNLWLGAYGVIWKYGDADQSWISFSLPDEFLMDYSFAYPQQILVDRTGDVWVIMHLCGGASCSGPATLYRIHNGEWSLIIESPDAFMPLKQLAMDGSGQVWLFWDGKVYQLDEDSIMPISSLAARGVDVSPNGKVWVVADEEEGVSLLVLEP